MLMLLLVNEAVSGHLPSRSATFPEIFLGIFATTEEWRSGGSQVVHYGKFLAQKGVLAERSGQTAATDTAKSQGTFPGLISDGGMYET
ncbi:hypothetical protein Shel_13920 [Slackia heliotrinireducens DSM 20476]|uniref:Uncharacterized protein n=1 Tax=Slackia heliotrinireducens (strain ATCC 29202 / DSM 20476 / NCTC 11029 / RHS 1) TaxID=471855 RepID=C7N678_SLAHD|nr:hypothetical protein Shel_13920 [Slackia heliotrinireducens DSM 20476]